MQSSELERARYLRVAEEQVYVMEHGCNNPVAIVLLCGPFASDRLFSLAAWAKWGRCLARGGMTAIRFDYRGTGESTGHFGMMDFNAWLKDICEIAGWAASNFKGVPLLLHGMGMGGLLAQKAFQLGLGKGLLMWSPPKQAVDILNQAMIVRLSMDMLLLSPAKRKTAQQYRDDLKAGKIVNVDGFPWSGRLWDSAEDLKLDSEYANPGRGQDGACRPWQHLQLGEDRAPLVRSNRVLRAMNPRAAIGPETPLNPDLTNFFQANLSWLAACVQEEADRRTRYA